MTLSTPVKRSHCTLIEKFAKVIVACNQSDDDDDDNNN